MRRDSCQTWARRSRRGGSSGSPGVTSSNTPSRDRWCPRSLSAKRALSTNRRRLGGRMKFEVRQRIQGSVDEVERAFLDERYAAFLLKHHGVLLELQPLERKDEGDRVRRKIRYLPKPVI